MLEIRTDLALEEKERFAGNDVEIPGVELEKVQHKDGMYQVSTVRIVNQEGAHIMHKEVGEYVTLENCGFDIYENDLQDALAEEVGTQISKMMDALRKQGRISEKKILVVGLGNRDATPDALGPTVINSIQTGDLVLGVAPGVRAQTGMETADYVRGIAKEGHAGVIIAIDSLAARNTCRLNNTIQITDTGIHPGSGVGNHRNAINEQTMGIPVIAIGVPTVVDAAIIVNDVLDNLMAVLEQTSPSMEGMTNVLENFTRAEKKQLVKELMNEETRDLYVTSKDIDGDIMVLGHIIAQGITAALS